MPGAVEGGGVVDEFVELGELPAADAPPVDGIPMVDPSVALGLLVREHDAVLVGRRHPGYLFAEGACYGRHGGAELGQKCVFRMASAEQTISGNAKRDVGRAEREETGNVAPREREVCASKNRFIGMHGGAPGR